MGFIDELFWWTGAVIWGLLVLSILAGIVLAVRGYFSRPKCPKCGSRETEMRVGGPEACAKCGLSTRNYNTWPEMKNLMST